MLQLFRRKPGSARAQDANAAAITSRMWDDVIADVRALKARQAALGDLAIDSENRIAKQAAQAEMQNQRFASAIDQLAGAINQDDERIRNLINSAVQVMSRVDDVSALARRVDKSLDELRDAFHAYRAISRGIEAADVLDAADLDQLRSQIETQALELGMVDAKLENFRVDAQRAIDTIIAAASVLTARVDKYGEIGELSARIAANIDKLHEKLFGELPAYSTVTGEPIAPAASVTKLSDVLARVNEVSALNMDHLDDPNYDNEAKLSTEGEG